MPDKSIKVLQTTNEIGHPRKTCSDLNEKTSPIFLNSDSNLCLTFVYIILYLEMTFGPA